jgi:hypothetical protein
MTAQMHDRINYQGHEYNLVGINGSELFNPEKFGFKPTGRVTSCGRGFVCHYILSGNTLVLSKLEVSYGHLGRTKFSPKKCPTINNVSPTYTEDRSARFNNLYENLNLKIEFTGGILIADDFIYKLGVNMGFHPAWKYRIIYELTFDNGQMINLQDVSKKMEEIREEMIQRPLEPGLDVDFREHARWVNSTFSLVYSYNNGKYELNIAKEPEEGYPSSLSEALEKLGSLPDDLDESESNPT